MLDLSTLSQKDAVLIQQGLAALGLYQGTFLGKPGPQTQEAYNLYHGQSATPPSTTSLPWIDEARKWLGLKEIAGSKHNPQIIKWWDWIKSGFKDDETAWCAGFVGGVLESVGIKSTRSGMARSYNSWGVKVAKPCFGCIAVFWRGSIGGSLGHVAFVVGQASNGDLFCIGGNQSDSVSVARFDRARVLSYRMPDSTYPQTELQVVSGPTQLSYSEA